MLLSNRILIYQEMNNRFSQFLIFLSICLYSCSEQKAKLLIVWNTLVEKEFAPFQIFNVIPT